MGRIDRQTDPCKVVMPDISIFPPTDVFNGCDEVVVQNHVELQLDPALKKSGPVPVSSPLPPQYGTVNMLKSHYSTASNMARPPPSYSQQQPIMMTEVVIDEPNHLTAAAASNGIGLYNNNDDTQGLVDDYEMQLDSKPGESYFIPSLMVTLVCWPGILCGAFAMLFSFLSKRSWDRKDPAKGITYRNYARRSLLIAMGITVVAILVLSVVSILMGKYVNPFTVISSSSSSGGHDTGTANNN